MSNAVPKKWSASNLGELCKFTGGSAFKEKYQGNDSGDYPFIKVSDMNLVGNQRFITKSNNWIDEDIKNEAKTKLFPLNSVVFAKVGAALLLNRRRILTRNTAIDNNMMAAQPYLDDNGFLYYLLQDIDLLSIVQSGAVPSVNQSQMEDIPVLIPSLPEQQKIAAILTSVDEVIEKTQAQIDKLKNLKIAMMQELLTCGVGVDSKPHTEFKDSPVGRIPKGWEVVSVDNVANVVDSMHLTPSFSDSGMPMVRVTEIRNSEVLDISSAVLVNQETFTSFSRNYQPKSGDTLIARVGAYFGATAFIDRDCKFCLGQNTASIRPENIIPEYLFLFLNSESVRLQMEDAVAVGAQPSLSLKAIKELKVGLPTIDEQEKISVSINSINQRKTIIELKLKMLKNTKKALMQDLLTGKVRVTVPSSPKASSLKAS